jgi:SAM-dependent methyltransferase
MRNRLRQLLLFWIALKAQQYAISRDMAGAEFIRFGQRLGWKLLQRGAPAVGEHLLTPVLSTRLFELPFAWSCLDSVCTPAQNQFLDVSSPRLFSCFVATQRPDSSIRIINPDKTDIGLTNDIAAALRLENIRCDQLSIDSLSSSNSTNLDTYDCIYAISVIEHIWTETYDDRQAVQWMYERLRPGGHLILTVPVDRRYWLEYRDENTYNLQSETNEGYFFQRFFDWPAIETRIIDVIGRRPSVVRWYGERESGYFAHHVEEWRKKGRTAAIRHPIEMVDHFREFDSWEQMPGIGVCGLLFTKPMT